MWEASVPADSLEESVPTAFEFMQQAHKLEAGGEEHEAIAKLANGMEAHPRDPAMLNALAWLLLTAKDKSLRDPQRALPLSRKAVELTAEKEGAVLDTLAVALQHTGDIIEAARYAQMAAKLCPTPEVQNRAREYAKKAGRMAGE